jgi:hypothetical protein
MNEFDFDLTTNLKKRNYNYLPIILIFSLCTLEWIIIISKKIINKESYRSII